LAKRNPLRVKSGPRKVEKSVATTHVLAEAEKNTRHVAGRINHRALYIQVLKTINVAGRILPARFFVFRINRPRLGFLYSRRHRAINRWGRLLFRKYF
jgi:hypothetical protein